MPAMLERRASVFSCLSYIALGLASYHPLLSMKFLSRTCPRLVGNYSVNFESVLGRAEAHTTETSLRQVE